MLGVGYGCLDRVVDFFERDALFFDVLLIDVRVDDGLILGCLIALAEDVVVAGCDGVDSRLIGVRIIRVFSDVNLPVLDVEVDAVGSVGDVRHGDIDSKDGLFDR